MAWLEIVKQSVSSKEVLDRYLGSTARCSYYGRDDKYLCPFHQDKNPSISINSKTGKWKCFGCGVGGDALDFVMMYFNVDQYTALKTLNDDFSLGFEHYVKDSEEKIKRIKLEKERKDKLIENERKIKKILNKNIDLSLKVMADIYERYSPHNGESMEEFSKNETRVDRSMWASYQMAYLYWLDNVISKISYQSWREYPSFCFDIAIAKHSPEEYENIYAKEVLDKNLLRRSNLIMDKLRENSIGLIADKFY